jgi:hypothetical protein
MAEQHVIGKHLVITDQDVVSVHLDGAVSPAEMLALHRLYEVRLRLHPRLFSVLHVARVVPPSPEVRKLMADWRRRHKVAGTAVIGAGLAVRTIATLYLRAVEMLGLRTWPVRFFDSEQAAQAYLRELRSRSG